MHLNQVLDGVERIREVFEFTPWPKVVATLHNRWDEKPNWILEKHKTPQLYKIYDTMQVLVTHLRKKSRVVKKERVTF